MTENKLDLVELAMVSMGHDDEAVDRLRYRLGLGTYDAERVVLKARADIETKRFIYHEEFLTLMSSARAYIGSVQGDLAGTPHAIQLEAAALAVAEATKIMDLPEFRFVGVNVDKFPN